MAVDQVSDWTHYLQLRLTSVTSVHILAPQDDGVYEVHFTLHNVVSIPDQEQKPLFTSSLKRVWSGCWVKWMDVSVDSRHRVFVLRVHFKSRSGSELQYSWQVHLHGLLCIGQSFNANRLRSTNAKTTRTSFVLGMARHLFAPPSSTWQPEDSDSIEPEMLPSSSSSKSSYSLSLLLRLLRVQRAVGRQQRANSDLRADIESKGLDLLSKTSLLEGVNQDHNGAMSAVSLRQQVFGNFSKSAMTRRKELRLKMKLEELKFKRSLLIDQIDRLTTMTKVTNDQIMSVSTAVDEQSNRLMSNMHALAREGNALKEWKGHFDDNARFTFTLKRQLTRLRHQLIKDINDFIYPLQTQDAQNMSLRWVSLPSIELAKSSSVQETSFSVVLGWLTHILYISSIILDLPPRFPVFHQGSMSRISEQLTKQVFPLFTKNVDVARVDLGIFLLNKDLAQMAWYAFKCNIDDIKATLRNWSVIVNVVNAENQGDDEIDSSMSSMMVALPSPLLAPLVFTAARIQGGSRRASIEEYDNVETVDNDEKRLDNMDDNVDDDEYIEEVEEVNENSKLIPWGDVTSRVDALSTQQTKFHRRSKQRHS